MFELIKLLDTVYRTISADLEAWFEQFPQGSRRTCSPTTVSEI